jgi:hypothetical protein
MTYDPRLAASLQGGVREDIQNNQVGPDTLALTSAQAAAETDERRRRDLASQTPGLGPLVALPQPPAGPGVGLSDVPLPVVGEGYEAQAAPQPLQVTVPHGVPVYGQRPSYGDDLVGGIGFTAGRQEAPIRVFVGQRSAPADGLVDVVSVGSGRPGLLSRARAVLGRLRGLSR